MAMYTYAISRLLILNCFMMLSEKNEAMNAMATTAIALVKNAQNGLRPLMMLQYVTFSRR